MRACCDLPKNFLMEGLLRRAWDRNKFLYLNVGSFLKSNAMSRLSFPFQPKGDRRVCRVYTLRYSCGRRRSTPIVHLIGLRCANRSIRNLTHPQQMTYIVHIHSGCIIGKGLHLKMQFSTLHFGKPLENREMRFFFIF